MCTHSSGVLEAEPAGTLEVRVTWDPHGGWDVEARCDGRVVASRHCDDWHRVERARRDLAAVQQPAADDTVPAASR